MMEVKTMFQVELLSGGVFTVYAVQPEAEIFLIYRDNQWEWIDIPECKPYTYPWPPLPTASASGLWEQERQSNERAEICRGNGTGGVGEWAERPKS